MSFVDIGIVWPRGRGSETFEEDVREVFFWGSQQFWWCVLQTKLGTLINKKLRSAKFQEVQNLITKYMLHPAI